MSVLVAREFFGFHRSKDVTESDVEGSIVLLSEDGECVIVF